MSQVMMGPHYNAFLSILESRASSVTYNNYLQCSALQREIFVFVICNIFHRENFGPDFMLVKTLIHNAIQLSEIQNEDCERQKKDQRLLAMSVFMFWWAVTGLAYVFRSVLTKHLKMKWTASCAKIKLNKRKTEIHVLLEDNKCRPTSLI